MLEFNIISNNKNKSLIELTIIRNKASVPYINTLVDTGASFPVWLGGVTTFLEQFPNSRQANAETIIRGFGHGFEVAPVFIIPLFELSDGTNKIAYRNLPIAVIKRDYTFSMIISFTMLNKMNFSYVSYTNRKEIKQINPVFRIYNHKQLYHMGYTQSPVASTLPENIAKQFKTPNIAGHTYIFTQ
jgi:hypothetical protein